MAAAPHRIGSRYLVFDELGRGGMATVHLGRVLGEGGFSRLVAMKKLRPECSSSYYEKALAREARLGSRIRHANVVQALDVVREGKDLVLVMEYVHGVALSRLVPSDGPVQLPTSVTVGIVADTLAGLHAAHDATDETGRPLGIVHRDVSPQNVLVGVDGVARLADFGIAKALRAEELTHSGAVKGKLAYMPPEQLRGFPLTRQADVYAAGILLAQCLAGDALTLEDAVDTRDARLEAALTRVNVPRALAEVVLTATAPEARARYASAAEMRAALLEAHARAGADEIAAQLQTLAGDDLELREELARQVERFDEQTLATDHVQDAPMSPPVVAAAQAPAAVLAPAPAASDAKARHAARVGYALGALGAVLGALLTMGWATRNAGAREPRELPVLRVAAPLATSMPADPTAAPPPSNAAAPAPSLASSAATAATGSASPAAPSTPAAAVPVLAQHGARPAKAAAPAPAASRTDCDVPYFLDAQGHKNYRRECLR